ncbi:hypothetical protein F4553_000124 [Allocatelliglobosispora scoriae]|uniref:Uncharacterized protein n=1 Tax=Allocatelliglobosispora scoriae TaxID=643052 RepID=A0A841BGI5_9ACTN|nr:hypothetical protein [Allocatelliglobosispora scoriae]
MTVQVAEAVSLAGFGSASAAVTVAVIEPASPDVQVERDARVGTSRSMPTAGWSLGAAVTGSDMRAPNTTHALSTKHYSNIAYFPLDFC